MAEEHETGRRVMVGEPRPRSGCRTVLAALLAVLIAALIFVLGLTAGGGSALFDRLLGGPRTPAPLPSPTIIPGSAILRQIQQVSRLETTIYSIEQVVEAKQTDPRWPAWLRGDRLLLIAHGRIVAGVDLGQVTREDVVVSPDGSHVTVRLPPVQIFNRNSILDNSKTRVYDRQQGLLSAPNTNLESQTRQAAEGVLLRAACDDGIMEKAAADAARAIEQLLQLFPVTVTVESSPAPACPEG